MTTISTSDNLLLSLCIPTYNRLMLLTEALSAIIIQIDDKFTRSVEILISNNASTDDTEKYVKEVIANHPHLQIRYLCNEANMGADTNICRVIKQAKGEWIYLLSDDDIFLPGGLAKLLELIEKYPDFDAFCLNMYSFDKDPYLQGKSVFDIAEDKIIMNKDESLIFFSTWITFISTLAFRRKAIVEKEHDDKIGTCLALCYSYLDVLVHGNGLYIVKDNFVAIRSNNTGGYNLFEVFVKNFSDLLTYSQTIGYSRSTVEKNLVEHGLNFLSFYIKTTKIKSINNQKFEVNFQQAISFVSSTYRGSIQLKLTGALLILLMILPPKIFSVSYFLIENIKSFAKIILFRKGYSNA
jgi:glycosyltransferase involved in cell wall biosynthesis